eukprot:3297153-Rhodomonas_salina.1
MIRLGVIDTVTVPVTLVTGHTTRAPGRAAGGVTQSERPAPRRFFASDRHARRCAAAGERARLRLTDRPVGLRLVTGPGTVGFKASRHGLDPTRTDVTEVAPLRLLVTVDRPVRVSPEAGCATPADGQPADRDSEAAELRQLDLARAPTQAEASRRSLGDRRTACRGLNGRAAGGWRIMMRMRTDSLA